MTLSDPVDQLDNSFYAPLSGTEPMGAPLPAEQLMALDQPIDAEGEAALPAYDARRETAAALLEKARDLRAYVRFVEAHAIIEGPKGLHAGLHLLDAVVRTHWDAIHPAPAGDPAAINARRRAFAPLREPKLASWFDRLVLFDAGGFERAVTVRQAWLLPDSQPATRGRRPAREGETVYDAASFAALVARAEAGPAVAEVHAALTASAAILKGLQAFFAAMPDYDSLRFAALAGELEVYATILAPFVQTVAAAGEAPSAAGDAEGADAAPAATAPAASAVGVPGSRAEALALFDAVIAFYAETSRSSPVALALVKLRGLESASFSEWLKELEPESSDDVRLWLGNVELAAAPERPADAAPDLSRLEGAVAALAAHEGAASVAPDEIAALLAALDALKADAPPSDTPVIRDRAAVRQALQRLAAYYRQAEPSNPASLCFERLIDLVDRSFLDILKRVAPKGLNSAALRLAG